MRLFPKRYSVCETCQVHFEPFKLKGSHLCSVHRGEWLELQRRKQAVAWWAQDHWEKLETQMKAEKAENDAISNEFSQNIQAHYSAMAQAQQSRLGGQLGGLGQFASGNMPFTPPQ